MLAIFCKRLIRYLRENWVRNLALFLLTVVVVTLVTTFFVTSYTILDGRKNNSSTECVEDGEFSLLIPLTDQQIVDLSTNYNATIEKIFSFDIVSNGKTFRIFKNRNNVNKLVLLEGEYPKSDNQIVIEQNFAHKNNIKLNDKLSIGANTFEVCGNGCIADYTCSLNKTTDATSDYVNFTWIIATDNTYNTLQSSGNYNEEYCYAFILANKDNYSDFQTAVTSIKFDYNSYSETNKYFKDFVQDQIREYKVQNAIDPNKNIGDIIKDVVNKTSDSVVKLATLYTDCKNELAPYYDDTSVRRLNESEFNDFKSIVLKYESFYKQGKNDLSNLYDYAINSGLEKLLPKEFSDYLGNVKLSFAKLFDIELKTDANVTVFSSFTYGGYSVYYEIEDKVNPIIEKRFKQITKLFEGTDVVFNDLKTYLNSEDFTKLVNDGLEMKIVLNNYSSKAVSFTNVDDNVRMQNEIEYAELYKKVSFICGILLFALLVVAFSIMIKHQINLESTIIGTQYALGVSKWSQMLFYLAPSLLITFLGGLVGLLFGTSKLCVNVSIEAFHLGNSFPYYQYSKPAIIYIYALLMPVFVSFIANFVVLNKTFSKRAIELIRGETHKENVKKATFKKVNFITRFQIRQIRREYSVITVIVGVVALTLVLFMLGINTHLLSVNVANVAKQKMPYNYMYTLRYPMSTLETDGEKVYVNTLQISANGTLVNVNVIGINENSKYYNFNVEKGQDICYASEAFTTKTGAKNGSIIKLNDNIFGKDYSLKIVKTVGTGINLEIFMDNDSMCELFGQLKGYYNAIISNNPLTIDENLVYSVITKDDIIRSSAQEKEVTTPFVVTSIMGSVALYLIVIYLVAGMLVDRNERGIALLSIFGYKSNEVRKMFVNGLIYLIVLSVIIAVPIAKIFTDFMCPLIYSRLPIGMFYSYPFYYYILIIAGAILGAVSILSLLVLKVKKINYSAVLKDI